MAKLKDTIYLCNFRVSTEGEWLCLKELKEVSGSGRVDRAKQIAYRGSKPEDRLDPMQIERRNLLDVSKLVVKELLDSSLSHGRMVTNELHAPLQQFFVVLEHVLRHGIKSKKEGFLGPKMEFWNVIELVERLAPDAREITLSVRDLPSVRTPLGRCRAWVRLALMQKKLPDYFKILLENRERLEQHYEKGSIMLEDEAVVIQGLLVGLNIVDFNLCFKDEDLDTKMGVIDFSLYLDKGDDDDDDDIDVLSSPDDDDDADDEDGDDGDGDVVPKIKTATTPSKSLSSGQRTSIGGIFSASMTTSQTVRTMTAVLDQKNYIEELNRHLNATVANLQGKLEKVQTANALMKEDLRLAKNQVTKLQEQNFILKHDNELLTHHYTKTLKKAGLSSSVRQSPLHHSNAYQTKEPRRSRTERANSTTTATPTRASSSTTASPSHRNANERRREEEELGNLRRELELERGMRMELEQAKKLLERDCHEKDQALQIFSQQLDDVKAINMRLYQKNQEFEKSFALKTDAVNQLETRCNRLMEMVKSLEKKQRKNAETDNVDDGVHYSRQRRRPERSKSERLQSSPFHLYNHPQHQLQSSTQQQQQQHPRTQEQSNEQQAPMSRSQRLHGVLQFEREQLERLRGDFRKLRADDDDEDDCESLEECDAD